MMLARSPSATEAVFPRYLSPSAKWEWKAPAEVPWVPVPSVKARL